MLTSKLIGLALPSGEIGTCDTRVKPFWPNVQPHKLICLLVLNLKMPITKVTGVLFGNLKDYMLQNLRIMPLSTRY